MINFREIFNISYSYIGLVLIFCLMIVLLSMDKRESVKIIGYSFIGAAIFMGMVYFIGNIFVNSFSYKFFVQIISDNLFNSIIFFSIISFIVGGISLGVYKYID